MEKTSKALKHINIEGIEFDIDPEVLDDVRFFEYLQEIEDGRPTSYIRVIKHILGDSYNKVISEFEKKDGKVSIAKSQQIFEEVTRQIDPKS